MKEPLLPAVVADESEPSIPDEPLDSAVRHVDNLRGPSRTALRGQQFPYPVGLVFSCRPSLRRNPSALPKPARPLARDLQLAGRRLQRQHVGRDGLGGETAIGGEHDGRETTSCPDPTTSAANAAASVGRHGALGCSASSTSGLSASARPSRSTHHRRAGRSTGGAGQMRGRQSRLSSARRLHVATDFVGHTLDRQRERNRKILLRRELLQQHAAALTRPKWSSIVIHRSDPSTDDVGSPNTTTSPLSGSDAGREQVDEHLGHHFVEAEQARAPGPRRISSSRMRSGRRLW